jgi:hypothetical protein
MDEGDTQISHSPPIGLRTRPLQVVDRDAQNAFQPFQQGRREGMSHKPAGPRD